MHKQDIIFTVTFVLALMILIYFLSGSITGHFIQSMHCEAGACRELCTSNTDCNAGEICCDKGNFGVCETRCEKEYVLQPGYDVAVSAFPMHSPSKRGAVIFYSVLTLLVIIIGAGYFLGRKKRSK
ncbi:hypothetical protein KY360_06815 [Candidatus Woesearchaeota archaeon]|nr:hypothetical protein [Candidatus Woesearchaeota archaeon]